MADTRVGEAIDAIVVSVRAWSTLAAPVQVYDGPIVSGDYAQRSVFIGYDGDPDGDFLAAHIAQSYVGPGDRVKDEQLTVPCCCIAWSGDDDMKTIRDACLVLAAGVNAALRDNPSQGLSLPASFNFAEGDLYQGPGPSGLQARLPFTITAKTRI